MVLILSDPDDLSTNDVIDWLRFYNIRYIRISKNNVITFKKVILNNHKTDIAFFLDNIEYHLSDFKAFWYRRNHYGFFINSIIKKNTINNQINLHLNYELKELIKFFENYISERSINKYEDNNLNKLEVLKIASEVGLTIPDSLICNTKKELEKFLEKHKNVITKNFSQGLFIFNKNKPLLSATTIITKEILDKLDDIFGYSLFQNQIEKLFELRVFYLFGKFYASAIFSQNDIMTQVDFRNYNFANPNRTPPFKLPKEIELKLNRLMKKLDLNCGSIDILVNSQCEYIFLEVNPVGQFSQVSKPCNYHLEQIIALELIKITNNEYKRSK